jgi:hypothetical protein
MFCSNCGKQINESAIFCDKCGAKVGTVYSQHAPEVTQLKSTKLSPTIVLKKGTNIVKTLFLLFAVMMFSVTLFANFVGNPTGKDLILTRLAVSSMIFFWFLLPAIILRFDKIRKFVPLFNKYKIHQTVIAWAGLFVIGFISVIAFNSQVSSDNETIQSAKNVSLYKNEAIASTESLENNDLLSAEITTETTTNQATESSTSEATTEATTAVTTEGTTIETTSRIDYLKSDVLQIPYAKMTGPNSVGGMTFDIDVKNKSEKVIKYVRFEILVVNAVGDPLNSDVDFDLEPRFWLKMTGPIEHTEISGLGRTWPDVFYNNSSKSWGITQIEIEYMDGTFYTIEGSDVKELET